MGYLHNRGDYGSYRGDPGILGTLGKLAGTAIGVVGELVPGPAGAIMRKGGRIIRGSRPTPPPPPRGVSPMMPAMPRMPFGAPSTSQRVTVNAAGEVVRKRRRMNVANPKALRKAIRRQEGFVKLARKALKGTGYKITRAGSSSRRPVTVREHGPGSVNIR